MGLYNEKLDVKITRPTLSSHLKKLEDKGEIERTIVPGKQGVHYILVDKKYIENALIAAILWQDALYLAEDFAKNCNVSKPFGHTLALMTNLLIAFSFFKEDQERAFGIAEYIIDWLFKGARNFKLEEGYKSIYEDFKKIMSAIKEKDADELRAIFHKTREEINKLQDEIRNECCK